MKKNDRPDASRLYTAIMTLNSAEECQMFFEDLCTIKEIDDMTQRMEVAEMLNENKSYQEVATATGASTATICRVNKCLNYGSNGYRTVLERINSSAIR